MHRAATGLPFDDIRRLIAEMPGPDLAARRAAEERQGQLVKPPGRAGAAGGDRGIFLAGWQGKAIPSVVRPTVAVFAATHGVCARGVSPYPPR